MNVAIQDVPEPQHGSSILSAALAESAEILLRRIEQAEELKARYFRLLTTAALFLSLAVSMVFLAIELVDFSTYRVVLTIGFAGTSASIFMVAYQAFELERNRRRREREIGELALRLESIIRIASQFEDHGKSDRFTRLLLDLRLTEAESALRRATTIRDIG